MRWSGVQTAAKRSGYLVFAMNQGQTPPMTQPGPWGSTRNGYCAGLAIRWIALRYAGLDYAYDRKTKVCDVPDWQATRDQTEFEGKEELRFPNNYAAIFAGYGLFINPGLVVQMKVAASGAILRQAGEASRGCHLITMNGTGGGHAVAMQNLGRDDWRFFDANFGEFTCSSAAKFGAFMDWLLKSAGYTSEHGVAVRTVFINPPPFTAANYQDLIRKQRRLLGR